MALVGPTRPSQEMPEHGLPRRTPASHYDLDTIRTNAAVALAVYVKLYRKYAGERSDDAAASTDQLHVHAKIALDDLQALQRRLQKLSRLTRSRRWLLPALM